MIVTSINTDIINRKYFLKYLNLSFSSFFLLAILLISPKPSLCLTFKIPDNSNIVGQIQTTTIQKDESFGDIGRRFDLGIYELIEANPQLNPWIPRAGAEIIIPSKFIIPSGHRKGIVINLAEMRLYYFHKCGQLVTTHPLGIGKKGWETPLGEGIITAKQPLPTWYPPASIIRDHASRGHTLPRVVPPGPKNPLGKFALRLSIPGYLIHGTNRPGGIGVRSSSGCIRLLPEDIKYLFNLVEVNDPIRIIHAPYKFGYVDSQIFIEAHQPLSEDYYKSNSITPDLKKLFSITNKEHFHLDWEHVDSTISQSRGFPILVPMKNQLKRVKLN